MKRHTRICVLLTALLLLVCYQEHQSTMSEKAFFQEFPQLIQLQEPISPYDPLLKKYADNIGWDWRLVAAVVYQESRFHNEAHSSKGAIGLMQIRSERYTPEELLNPERNLEVGTRYLKRLEGMFPAASPVEGVKFALAAYNLGEGRITRCIEKAQAAGLDATRWDSVSQTLSEGHHTIDYVQNVLDTYRKYSRLYPR